MARASSKPRPVPVLPYFSAPPPRVSVSRCARVEDTVAALLARYGSGARICVLPEGPQTIPYVADG